MTDAHRSWTTLGCRYSQDSDKCGPDVMRECLIQLIWVNSPNVVGLDDRVEIAHDGRLSANPQPHPGAGLADLGNYQRPSWSKGLSPASGVDVKTG